MGEGAFITRPDVERDSLSGVYWNFRLQVCPSLVYLDTLLGVYLYSVISFSISPLSMSFCYNCTCPSLLLPVFVCIFVR